MRIRLFGLLLLGISAAAFYALTHLVALPAADRSSVLEFATGIICVATEMLGLPMLALGAGLLAPTDIPPRSWYPVRGIRRPAKEDVDAARDPFVY